MREVYSSEFFDNQRSGSGRSAALILPLLVDIFGPMSLLDVGCGQGTWLKTATDFGINDRMGVDGDWARPFLAIPAECFRAFNVGAAFDLGRRFDLVISLEVAEHIVASNAETFIGNLIRHSDAIVFSAAIPFQGGTHHVNEQWPSYWASLFMKRGYRCFDFLRWRIWNEAGIPPWYRQNLLIFANTGNTNLIDRLEGQLRKPPPPALAVVHPEIWADMMNSKSLRYQRLMTPAVDRIRTFFRSATKAGHGTRTRQQT